MNGRLIVVGILLVCCSAGCRRAKGGVDAPDDAGSANTADSGGKNDTVDGSMGGGGAGNASKDAGSSDGSVTSLDAGADLVYKVWPFDTKEAVRRQKETAELLGLETEVQFKLGNGVVMPMVVIPAGVSILGSKPTVENYESDEQLVDYTQTKPFLIGKTVFTRAQYKALIGVYPSQPPDGNSRALLMTDSDKEPALALYYTVKTIILPALNKLAPKGWKFRLARHEEWEYAARGGTDTVWYSGDTPADLAKIAWYIDNSDGKLHDVALKLPNPWGLYDMIGNAWQWIYAPEADLYGDRDPIAHLVRGCEANEFPFANGCRTANRMISDSGVSYRFMTYLPEEAGE